MTILVGEEDEFNLSLAGMLDLELISLSNKVQQDGEITPKIGKRVLMNEQVIFCTRKGVDENPNDYWSRFLFSVGGLSKKGAMVTAVMPYLIYARQDKDFLSDKDEFEPISIEILLENLAAYAKELVTFNAHFERKEKVITKYALPIYNIDAFKVLEDSLDNISDLVIIAPDKGMRDFSKDLAQSHNAGFDYLNKKRDKVTREITFLPKDFDIAGKNVVIPDDIASTCGTLIKSIEHLKQYEPKDIYAMFVHGAFTEGAQDNLEKACNNIIFTNTINNPKATVHVEEYLAEYLRSNVIHNKKQWVPEA